MRAPLTGALAALALAVPAVFATPSTAQDPLPTLTATPSPSPAGTATPSPTPTPAERERAERDRRDRRAKPVRAIYRDFERDGRIDDCDHTEEALKRARRSISDSYADDYPDFRDALTAAIERHQSGRCEEQEQQRDDANSDPTPTPTATPAPSGGGGSTPAPAAPAAPAPPPPSPDSGALPDFGSGGSGGTGGNGGDSGGIGDIDPLPEPGEDAIPEGTPSPTPAPAATPAPPPKLVVTRASADPHLFVPGTLLAIALVGLALAALSALVAKRTGRLEGLDHAWQEAAWRTSGTWSDFTDWLRSGR